MVPDSGFYFFGLDRALGTGVGAATPNQILSLTILIAVLRPGSGGRIWTARHIESTQTTA